MPLLPVPQPYDLELSASRFRAFGPDLANLWHDGGLHRVVAGRELRIEPAAGGAVVEPLPPEAEPAVRHLLGLAFDLDAFAAFAAGDATLAPVVERFRGFRPLLVHDPFEALVTSITAQQVSLFSAVAVRNRLIARYGVRAGEAYAFPAAERLACADPADLVPLGFSRRKAEYVVGVARAMPELRALRGLSDDEVRSRIVRVRGLGEWTADWFLARHLARPRAWPAGDLGLRRAASRFYGEGRDLSTEEVRALGTRFEPFQNLTAHVLLTATLLDP